MAGPFERADFQKLVPLDKKLTPQWLASLTARGEPNVLSGADLKFVGMPVGGIGAGQLYLGGDGKLWRWDLFNDHLATGAERYAHPDKTGLAVEQGFELRATVGERSQTRRLDASGFPRVTFLGQYPIGTVRYEDPAFPISAKLEAFSPFIPLSADDSSLPATVLHFTLTNTTTEPLTATLAGWLQNAVLLTAPHVIATRTNRIVRGNAMTFLECAVEKPQAAPAAHPPQPEIVFEDWNKDDYAGWTVAGDAFGARPAHRSEVLSYMGDIGPIGDRFVHSHISAPGKSIGEKDNPTGTLTSKPFTIDRDFISVWIGGGNHPGATCFNVLVDGQVVASLTGQNRNEMTARQIDLSKHRGRQAHIEIVDRQKGDWGNIGVGKIVFTDTPAPATPLHELPQYGTMGLALLGEPPQVSIPAAASGGLSANPLPVDTAPLQAPLIGTLARTLELGAGQSAKVDFVVAWHFPNLALERLGKVGRFYATKFQSAQAVAQYVADQFDRLHSQTVAFRDTWYDSSLPHWLLDRTLLNVSTLATSTCYRFADGRFYAWEGVGCCPGTCTHVWHYAHSMARLFPELERDLRERVDLKIAMHPDGVMGFRAEFDQGLAVDGQAGTILRCYREHQMSADGKFLQRNWPAIRRAFEPLLKLDGNDDGLLEGAQMNTLDKPWFGKVAWLSGMYLASLRAGEQMALEMGDAPFAERCKTVAARGAVNVVDQLFNGEYFANIVDPAKAESINSGSGCEIDEVLGQSWAFQVGIDRVLPKEQTLAALRSLWKYNFTPDVGPYRAAYKAGRWYAMPGEAGLLMCTFPRADWDYPQAMGKGPEWASGYFNECMNGFEHQVAGHMIWEGLLTEGLAIERAIHDRYAPSRRNPWNEIECGDHYARSMASHGVYLAVCGFEYHGPRGYLSMAPRLAADDFRAALITAEGWGSYAQQRRGDTLRVTVSIQHGRLRLRTLALPGSTVPAQLALTLGGKPIASDCRIVGQKREIRLAADLIIGAGETLQCVMS